MDLERVRRLGAKNAAREAIAHLNRDGLDGFWIHLDADVVDDAVMPAVDYRIPDGLGWTELTAVLHTAMRTGGATGLEVTIFNPRLDPDGRIAGELVSAVAEGLPPRAPSTHHA
jgi:arginase